MIYLGGGGGGFNCQNIVTVYDKVLGVKNGLKSVNQGIIEILA